MIKYLKRIGLKRIICMLIGVFLIGASVACLRLAGIGTDPYSCMNIGVSQHLPIGYGTFQLIVNIVLFIPVIILYPKSFGLGAVANMVGVGYSAEFVLWICTKLQVTEEKLAPFLFGRGGLLIIGILLLCFGVALYMECDLGAASYDMVAQIIEDRTHGKFPFRWARVFCDFICIFIGFVSGGTVGIATLVVGFCTGPIVTWFRKHVVIKMGIQREVEQPLEE